MKARNLFLLVMVLFGLYSVSAQEESSPFNSNQRDFSIKFPLATVYAGQTINVELTTRYSLVKPSDYRIEWRVSGGNITDGQGTPIIKIETDENAAELEIIVDILDFSVDDLRVSGKLELAKRPIAVLAKEVNNLLSIDKNSLTVLLQEYFNQLNQNTSAQGFILIYPKKNRDFTKIKNQILEFARNNKIEISRVEFFGKPKDNNKVRFYIVPEGAKNPT